MKFQITEFFGYIKWLVTDEVFFVDPQYLDELDRLDKFYESDESPQDNKEEDRFRKH